MHTIRLRGPWEFRSVQSPDDPLKRLKLPADWASVLAEVTDSTELSEFEFHRAFHKPTGLTPTDTVQLVFDDLPDATVWMNELPLGVTSDQSSTRFDITQSLADRNRLRVTLTLSPGQARHGEVAIEIG